MRKLIAAINMTLDGDHTSIIPDDEIHQHYADLLNNAGTGRPNLQKRKMCFSFITSI
jgi:hypothetical protein